MICQGFRLDEFMQAVEKAVGKVVAPFQASFRASVLIHPQPGLSNAQK